METWMWICIAYILGCILGYIIGKQVGWQKGFLEAKRIVNQYNWPFSPK